MRVIAPGCDELDRWMQGYLQPLLDMQSNDQRMSSKPSLVLSIQAAQDTGSGRYSSR